VLNAAELRELEVYHRYEPADAESVAARTLPGVSELGAYFTRGSGHTIEGGYTEYPEEYQAVLDRLARKHTSAAEHTPAPLVDERAHSPLAIVTLGELRARRAGGDRAAAERRMSSPTTCVSGASHSAAGVRAFLENHETIVVVEQNR